MVDVTSEGGWRVFLGPLLLLVFIFLVWFVRYPMWGYFNFAEPIFLMLILSYSVVLFLSLFLLKRDAKRALSKVFEMRGFSMVFFGVVFAFLFQGVWFLISLGVGGKLEFLSFPSLRGYEDYAVYSILSAFLLYAVFAVFGAFVEEVAFRGYIQSRIASRHGSIVGIFVASLFFSLQHIHVFQLDWIMRFLQRQFVYVFCFSIFVGYLFIKSKENIWSIFAFHASMNILNITLPIEITEALPMANNLTTPLTFTFMILLLRFMSKGQTNIQH